MKLTWLLLPLTLLCACDLPDHVVVDSGSVCFVPEDVAVHDDTTDLQLTVRLDECISACAEGAEASCEAQVQGETIAVYSEGSWSEPEGDCIALCAALEAECVVQDVAPGTYTVEHGDESWPLVLPSALESACL